MRLLFIGLGLFVIPLYMNIQAQDEEHPHEHSQHMHKHEKNEIGLGNAITYFFDEQEAAFGMHLHYMRSIGDSDFSLGMGYERVFDEHGHNTIGIIGGYRLLGDLVLQISPGLSYSDGGLAETDLVMHLEVSYEFEIGNFHLGPVAGFSLAPQHYHAGLGVHVAYAF